MCIPDVNNVDVIKVLWQQFTEKLDQVTNLKAEILRLEQSRFTSQFVAILYVIAN